MDEKQRAQREALANLFEAVPAPRDHDEAVDELRGAGIDPQRAGARMARLARAALVESGPEIPVPVTPPRPSVSWRRTWLALSATATLLFVWLVAEDRPPRQRLTARPPAGDRSLPPQAARQNEPSPHAASEDVKVGVRVATNETPLAQETAHPAAEATPPSPEGAQAAEPPLPDYYTQQPGTVAGAPVAGEPWVLDRSNWQEADGLLPEVVLNRVKSGDYWFRVQPVDAARFRRNYSPRFWQASAANAGTYDVDPATCGLKEKATGAIPSFYFGYPFPAIDPKDPHAGCKVAWNIEAASAMGDGGGATFTLNGVDSEGEFTRVKLWRHWQSFLGRHAGPLENPEAARNTFITVYPDQRARSLAIQRNNWERSIDWWLWVPAPRVVRRKSTAALLSDPVAGLDIFGEDFNCFAGKNEFYSWKLIGEGNVLAPLSTPEPIPVRPISESRSEVILPRLKAAYEVPNSDAVPWLIVENLVLVPRPVWIMEIRADDPYYNFGKTILYVDKEMHRIYWKLVHNRAGEYFYNAMCVHHWAQSEDGSFSAVSTTAVVGVNDKTNRACIAGRPATEFFERKFPADYFTLRRLTRLDD